MLEGPTNLGYGGGWDLLCLQHVRDGWAHWACVFFQFQLNQSIRAPLNEPGHAKMCLMPYANNQGADQPARISAFVVRSLDSIISLVSRSEISRF